MSLPIKFKFTASFDTVYTATLQEDSPTYIVTWGTTGCEAHMYYTFCAVEQLVECGVWKIIDER